MSRTIFKSLLAMLASAALALSFAACSDDDDDGGGGGSGGTPPSGEIETGPGVTNDGIRLGVLTDTSGVFAGLGIPLTDGTRAFWRQQNAAGGVCNRRVTLDVKDHGYDPQKASGLYRQVGDKILAAFLLGSPVTAALLPSLQEDKMLSVLASWSSQLVANPNVVIVGATYDTESINVLDHLIEEGKLKRGDRLGHVFFEGEYGENALLGSQHLAEKEGLELVEQKIKATDTDLSGQVANLRREKVDAILVSTGPRQLASLAGVAAASGLDVPIASHGPSFDPELLKTPAAKALEKVTVVTTTSPYSHDAPGVRKAVAAYEKAFPKGGKKYSVMAGWAEAQMMHEVLKKACENKDLTREGLQTALRELSDVDLQGVVAGPLDYSEVGQPPSREVYIAKVDPKADGGLTVLGGPRSSENAKAYELEAPE